MRTNNTQFISMEKKSKKAAATPKGKTAVGASRKKAEWVARAGDPTPVQPNGSGKKAVNENTNAALQSNSKNGKDPKNAKSNGSGQGAQLREFFLEELKDLYWAEKHLVKALSKMAKEATTKELKEAFTEHRSETEDHVSRLEEVFEMAGESAEAKKCDAIIGITREVESVIENTKDDSYTRDVALIIGAQKAEHYEIASYGGLIQLAMVLGYDDAAELLLQTLDEEKSADSTLTSIAENKINEEALTE
jgi:ferritin-like metal-binding protein YciE